jgi:octaheme c-type cytochrome (tetrathionate reductase family)
VDLNQAARSVGLPKRKNCGVCHFYGGGDDGVKHGDLDSSLLQPDKKLDIHMAVDGANMSCTACHTTVNHRISGRYYTEPAPGKRELALPKDDGNRLACESCHGVRPHRKIAKLNDHIDTVACQTCHIPAFARGGVPTKMWWDWSTAGRFDEQGKMIVEKDARGMVVYHTTKGSMAWEENVLPIYAWYDGRMRYVHLTDTIDPSRTVELNRPLGAPGDGKARIFPFKYYTGRQVYDAGENHLVIPKLFGPNGSGAYWGGYDWQKAVEVGMAEAGERFSGRIGFIDTAMYWPITHMVAPAKDALECDVCHAKKGRLAQLTGFYLPGRDRSPLVDRIGWLVVLVTIVGTLIHGGGRWYAARRREGR